MLLRPDDRRRDAERGSLVIALAIILVVGLLGSVITERAVGAAFDSRSHQDTDAAVSQADAGLADALYRIDQGAAGTGGGSAFCIGTDEHCLASAVPAAAGVSYFAKQVSSTDWLVESRSTVGRTSGAVEGHVTEQPMYPFAVFGNSSLGVSNFGSQTFSTYTPSSPAGTGNPNPNGAVSVGSNGTITCNGSLGGAVTLAYYGSGGVNSTGSSSCGTYQSNATRYLAADPSAPAGALPCPVFGGSGTLAAGTYLCTTPVILSGQLTVSGPVQLYVIGASLTILPGSVVNDSGPGLPSSQNLEILTNYNGSIGTTGTGFVLGALLDAPDATLTNNSCSSQYYGTVIVSALSCTGSPTMTVSYDQSLATVYGAWTAGSYTQISASTFASDMRAAGL